jgi:hypothetical protein
MATASLHIGGETGHHGCASALVVQSHSRAKRRMIPPAEAFREPTKKQIRIDTEQGEGSP